MLNVQSIYKRFTSYLNSLPAPRMAHLLGEYTMYFSEAYIERELNEHCLPFAPFKIKHKSKVIKKGDKTFYPAKLLTHWLIEYVY